MGDDGLLGGTTTVDDLKISGNISATNTSIIGGKFTEIISYVRPRKIWINLQFSKYFILQFLHVGIQSGSGVHLPSVGNRQQPQAKPDQVSTSTQPLAGANNLELGELEQLTITNDNESSYDVSYLYSSGVIRIKKHNVFALFPYKT